MPRVLAHTPEWLKQPSPGYQLFAETEKAAQLNGKSRTSAYNGPLKKIARGRGTEVFVASGDELRWADLQTLKYNFELDDGEPQGASRVRLASIKMKDRADFHRSSKSQVMEI
jgi:hypothetical protein